jgi:hypothetical protein
MCDYKDILGGSIFTKTFDNIKLSPSRKIASSRLMCGGCQGTGYIQNFGIWEFGFVFMKGLVDCV